MKNKEFNNLQMMMDIKVPMSDGVTLSTNVYLPKNNIPCPVILQRSPYGTNTEDMVKEAINFVKEGYEKAILTVPASDNVVRLLPALNITIEEINEALSRLEQTAHSLRIAK